MPPWAGAKGADRLSDPMGDGETQARVRSDLASAIALEAGAGTGKTTALVARILALLRAGVPVRRLVVVTFLRAAAEEMRVRLRERLAEEGGAWARAAEAELPAATIGTIHSFAQRLLAQEAEAAAWDPATRVLEEDEREALDRHHFRAWLEEAVAAHAVPLLELRRLGQSLSAPTLLALARALGADAVLPETPEALTAADIDAFEAELRDALATFERLAPACQDASDKALGAGERLGQALLELAAWSGSERIAAACRLTLPRPDQGNKAKWRPETALKQLKDSLRALADRQAALRQRAGAHATAALLHWLAPYPAFAAARRESLGVATFDDLLNRAVSFLERDAAARERTRRRYDVLLVDEFQDTDDVQARLITLVAGEPGHAREGHARLFVVGDPKQAIYRFRGADVDAYLAFTARFPEDGRLPLLDNHRARPALLELPNRIVMPLMATGSIPYRALRGGRDDAVAEDAPAPIQVLVAPSPASPTTIEESRRCEAEWVAAYVRGALDRWRIAGGPLAAGDVALLFRTRTAYPVYVEALERHGVPYQAERDTGLWRAGVGRDVVLLLLAFARPHSPIAVAAALRTTLVGASDEDLLRFVQAGGRFDLDATVPAGAPAVVRRALEALAVAAMARAERPSRRLLSLIERLDLASAAVLAEGERGGRALAQTLESVRLLEVRRPGGVGALADVAAALDGVGAPAMADEVLPVPAPAADPPRADGAVRLLTVHEAKGNQFRVVVLCDVGGGRRPDGTHLLVSPTDRRVGVVLTAAWGEPALASPAAIALRERDRALESEEQVRLLYVALTRARDVLILPDAPFKADKPAADSVAGLILKAAGLDNGSMRTALTALGVPFVATAPPPATATLPERLDALLLERPSSHLEVRERMRAAAAVRILRPSESELSAIASGTAAAGTVAERERARRLGLAVHRVFAAALTGACPDGLDACASLAARREGLMPEDGAEVARLARTALDHPLVARARLAPRRAVEASLTARTETGDLVLGRADLVFAERTGAVVVDLKTDRLPHADEPAARAHAHAHGYDRQLALYALALASAAVGPPVREAWVLYARAAIAVRVGPGTAP